MSVVCTGHLKIGRQGNTAGGDGIEALLDHFFAVVGLHFFVGSNLFGQLVRWCPQLFCPNKFEPGFLRTGPFRFFFDS